MNIDISVWKNIERVRELANNNAKVLASFTALNFVIMWYYKNYLVMIINAIGFLSAVMGIVSYSKFKKEPPQ